MATSERERAWSMVSAPCPLRNAAITALDDAHIEWNEVFIGQGAACVGAAAAAGLAVAVLAERAAPTETVDLSLKLRLPPLPTRKVALHSTLRDRRSREALEIVLFFRALALGAPGHSAAVLAGAAVGVAGLTALVLVMSQLGRRLNPRPVMLASSVLLAALAVTLVGRGVRALQEGGFVGLTSLPLPDLSVIGIYPTLQGLMAQAATFVALFAPSLVERWRGRPTKFTGA